MKNESQFLNQVFAEKVYMADREVNIENVPWDPHPQFAGVFLKHLVLGKDTGNHLSCHIVKIEPNCVLDTHLHDGKVELHEVVAGRAVAYLDKMEMEYIPGRSCVVPANVTHSIHAGDEGVYIFAKFAPALK